MTRIATTHDLRPARQLHSLGKAPRSRRHAIVAIACEQSQECLGANSRRDIISMAVLFACRMSHLEPASAAEEPSAPQVGACVECIGEVNGGLNACTLASPSCVSTQNDDEAHFIPPWQYNGDMQAAVQELITTATGRGPVSVASSDPTVSLQDAANYALEELGATFRGNPPPQKPSRRTSAPSKVCFNGRLEDRHTVDDGSEYLHFVFGGPSATDVGCKTSGVIDVEFIFLSGDNVVDIRTASREDPGVRGGNLSLSLSYGVQYDTNVAKRVMEELRKALRWEQVPVVTDFDPRFNQRRPLFFERLYQPFLRDKQEFEDIVDK